MTLVYEAACDGCMILGVDMSLMVCEGEELFITIGRYPTRVGEAPA